MDDSSSYGPDGAAACPTIYWSAPTPFNPSAPTKGTPLVAFINEGRWIVACHCGGAQLASLDDKRFMCCECANLSNGGAWLPVTYPAALPDIVAALDVRIDPVDQNWLPGETVAALLAENVNIPTEHIPPIVLPLNGVSP